jgi:hypothetical protein
MLNSEIKRFMSDYTPIIPYAISFECPLCGCNHFVLTHGVTRDLPFICTEYEYRCDNPDCSCSIWIDEQKLLDKYVYGRH